MPDNESNVMNSHLNMEDLDPPNNAADGDDFNGVMPQRCPSHLRGGNQSILYLRVQAFKSRSSNGRDTARNPT